MRIFIMEQKIIRMPTSIPGISAHISIHSKYLRGYLISSNGSPIIPKKSRRINVRYEAEIEQKAIVLTNRLTAQYNKAHRNGDSRPSTAGTFTEAYNAIEDKNELNGNWAASTAEKTHAFCTTVLKMMDKYGAEITNHDMRTIYDELLNRANCNKNSYKNDETVNNLIDTLRRVNIILTKLEKLTLELPEVKFSLPEKIRVQKAEQIKAIREECRVELSLNLLEAVQSNPMALACGIMYCGGARTGEAAAISFADINIWGRYATIYIEKRIDNAGKITDILKTDQAYRLIVLPYYFVCLYKLCAEGLQAKGYSMDDIMCMRLVNTSLGTFSAYCRKQLESAGVTGSEFEGAYHLMEREPDIVDGRRENDVTAYLLRRDWASRMMDCCDMSAEDVDYYIGHKKEGKRDKYHLDPQRIENTARVMERYVYLPELSYHPAYRAVEIRNDTDIALDASRRYHLRSVDSPAKIHIEVQGTEAGPIEIFVPHKPTGLRAKALPDEVEARNGRPILGDIYSDAHYIRRKEDEG